MILDYFYKLFMLIILAMLFIVVGSMILIASLILAIFLDKEDFYGQ